MNAFGLPFSFKINFSLIAEDDSIRIETYVKFAMLLNYVIIKHRSDFPYGELLITHLQPRLLSPL